MKDILSGFGQSPAERLLAAAFILLGVTAVVRYGGEIAFALGNFVGSH